MYKQNSVWKINVYLIYNKQTFITVDTCKPRLTLTGVIVHMVSTISIDAWRRLILIDVWNELKIKMTQKGVHTLDYIKIYVINLSIFVDKIIFLTLILFYIRFSIFNA